METLDALDHIAINDILCRFFLAFDERDRLWASELGQDRWDEVNQVVRGGNYGWPVVEGRSSDTRFRAPAHVWSSM